MEESDEAARLLAEAAGARYDRQERLFGLSSAAALQECSVLMLGVSAAASEALRLLVVAGVGRVFVAAERVPVCACCTLGSSFLFGPQDRHAESEAAALAAAAAALNADSRVHFAEVSVEAFLEQSAQTSAASCPVPPLHEFSLVIASDLSLDEEAALLRRLNALGPGGGAPSLLRRPSLVSVHCAGLFGSVRVFPSGAFFTDASQEALRSAFVASALELGLGALSPRALEELGPRLSPSVLRDAPFVALLTQVRGGSERLGAPPLRVVVCGASFPSSSLDLLRGPSSQALLAVRGESSAEAEEASVVRALNVLKEKGASSAAFEQAKLHARTATRAEFAAAFAEALAVSLCDSQTSFSFRSLGRGQAGRAPLLGVSAAQTVQGCAAPFERLASDVLEIVESGEALPALRSVGETKTALLAAATAAFVRRSGRLPHQPLRVDFDVPASQGATESCRRVREEYSRRAAADAEALRELALGAAEKVADSLKGKNAAAETLARVCKDLAASLRSEEIFNFLHLLPRLRLCGRREQRESVAEEETAASDCDEGRLALLPWLSAYFASRLCAKEGPLPPQETDALDAALLARGLPRAEARRVQEMRQWRCISKPNRRLRWRCWPPTATLIGSVTAQEGLKNLLAVFESLNREAFLFHAGERRAAVLRL